MTVVDVCGIIKPERISIMATRAGVGLGSDLRGLKPGKSRHSKKKKGNAPSKTARCGNGKKIR